MTRPHDAASALTGAWHLARFDARGMDYFAGTPDSAWRSFATALVVIPAYLGLALVRFSDQLEQASLVRFVSLEMLSFIVSWVGYALAMYHFTRFLEREQRYPAFLEAYNWSAVVQLVIYLPTALLGELELLPEGLDQGLAFAVTIMVMVYQWFVTRTALELPGSTALGLMLLDFIVSAFVSGIANDMLCGGLTGVSC